MWVVTDGKLKWVGEGKIDTGKGLVDPENPPEWATVFEAEFLDKLEKIKRGPQVVNAKDVGLLVSLTGLGVGWNVAEGGSGSGFLTSWLAHLVNPGRVHSYELREDFHKLASDNVKRMGFDNVTFKNKSIFDLGETGLDLVIFDLPNPWDGVDAAFNALRTGGYFVAYLPTTNQVRKWLIAARKFSNHQVTTSIVRGWRTDPDAFRPKSKTLAHTAFICVCRKLI
jgi:tRNA (adenine57-N1/adenine58-N1)-methyltransferase